MKEVGPEGLNPGDKFHRHSHPEECLEVAGPIASRIVTPHDHPYNAVYTVPVVDRPAITLRDDETVVVHDA
jgi:hypothetical protein